MRLLNCKGTAMKKTLPVELNYCDNCGNQHDYLTACMSCGIEHCYECRKTAGKEYPHAVHCGGSNDGYYCRPCDRKLSISGTDKRFAAYREIEALRAECSEWGAAFERKRKVAEAAVTALIER